MTLKAWTAIAAALLLSSCATVRPQVSVSRIAACWGELPVAAADYNHDLILGEIHGTSESPAVISAYICQARAENHRVSLAIELPPEALAAGMRGDTSGPFWRSNFRDGRSSQAMLSFLTSLRPFVRDGTVKVFGFDGPYQDWETEAAASIAGQRDHRRWLVVYTGNFHARRPASGPPTFATAMPNAKSVNIAAQQSGTAWICTPTCGVTPVGGMRTMALGLSPADPATGFDFNFVLPRFSASEPAAPPPAREPTATPGASP